MYDISKIKTITEPIARKYNIEKIWLFGSYVRGEQTEQSDIDFHIDRGDVCSGFQLGAFYTELEDALGKQLDVVATQSLSEEFLKKIEKEERLIYVK